MVVGGVGKDSLDRQQRRTARAMVLANRNPGHIFEWYAHATGQPLHAAVVIDREGMGASFLFTMLLAGHTVITCLRAGQYTGLESFTDVEPFVTQYG